MWKSVRSGLPDKKTKYAGKFGVTVLAWDQYEHDDSGYCDPRESHFNFEKGYFEIMCIGGAGQTSWTPDSVTHWMPLPDVPNSENIEQKQSNTQQAKGGQNDVHRTI